MADDDEDEAATPSTSKIKENINESLKIIGEQEMFSHASPFSGIPSSFQVYIRLNIC